MLANQALKDAWILALRSGKYTKGKRQFKTSNGAYCCLGVLCMVLKHPEWIHGTRQKVDNYVALRRESGLTTAETDKLGHINDYGGDSELTFQQIADYIEQHITSV